MSEGIIDYSSMPYRKFSQIRIRNSEPFTSDYLNAHISRLCSNLDSLKDTNTIQKAGYEQWGTVRKATVDDFLNPEEYSGTAVVTNDVVNRVVDTMHSENAEQLFTKGSINLSKHYILKRGSFVVSTGSKIAKRITTDPEGVVFTRLNIVPVGYERKAFYTTKVSKTDEESFKNCNQKNVGVIEFTDSGTPTNYTPFNIYYHQSGYVICNIGNIMETQKQFTVNWMQMLKV